MILITSFVFFLFFNNVRSEFVSNSDVENVKRVVRGEYQYNHPPSAEFFSVPVAVYYEGGSQKEKSIQADVSATELTKDTTSFENETSEPVATASEPNVDGKEIIDEKSIESTVPTPESNTYIETTESLSSSPTESNVITISDIRNKMRDSKRFRPQEGLIIPVAVVYDVEPETLRSRKRPTVKTDKKPINRQQRNNISETVNDVRERESKSINEPREGPPKENIKAGIFPKRSQEPNQIIPIVQSENFVYSHSGNFHYSYEGGDGTKAYERGELRADKAGEAVEGSFSYTGKDGKDYSLTYTADENGYRPVGDHLPTPPPIPPAIARALKYLATKPTPESQTETYY